MTATGKASGILACPKTPRPKSFRGVAGAALLCGTALVGIGLMPLSPVYAQATAAAEEGTVITELRVEGNQRFEASTVLSYVRLRVGDTYNQRTADEALRALYQTELFADVAIRNDGGVVTVIVKENPIINRILVEGNKSIKADKILPEIKLAPRQVFTRSKVRADTARIIELYKRKGRFGATVEPKMVMLDQNRVDIVYEINEGPKSKVRQINILGNDNFKDGKLKGEMMTKEASLLRVLSSGTTYDPDRLAFDQQVLRQFYLTEGYADFRVVSAVAELTPDKKDFIITYVVSEGERYKFGKVEVESDIRDLSPDLLKTLVPVKEGEWYNAKSVEDTVDRMTENAGLFGYANAQVRPVFKRNKDTLTMDVTFRVEQSPRVYIERIDVTGNTSTRDKVIRREMRVTEGDVFNSFLIERSENRIKSLGYFQEKFAIEQVEGSTPDRVRLVANVEEGNTGELQLSAGFSSIERFIFSGSIAKRNFRGLGQEVRASASYSSYSKSFEVGFTEPYLFNKNIALAGDIFRRDYNSFNYLGNTRQTTYGNTSTGFQVRTGIPINEYLYFSGRYGLSFEDVSLDEATYYSDSDGNGVLACEPLVAGRYLCDAIGKRTTSALGMSLIYDRRNNSFRPTAGHSVTFNVDWAGLGGNVRYVKSRIKADKYFNLGSGWIVSARAEGGYVHPLNESGGVEGVRLTDRFFLGEPEMRGFDIRGVGPRVIRYGVDSTLPAAPVINFDRTNSFDDALGGRAYYLGRLELEIPLGNSIREMGIRPSIFVDVGANFGVKDPQLTTVANTFTDTDGNVKTLCILAAGGTAFATQATPAAGATPTGPYAVCPTGARTISPYQEAFLGDTWKPRIALGIGVDWNSPFGPFRINFAQTVIKRDGDDTKRFSFNVGTSFR
jgi:outer membrane protein insertion porin family